MKKFLLLVVAILLTGAFNVASVDARTVIRAGGQRAVVRVVGPVDPWKDWDSWWGRPGRFCGCR